MCFVSLREGGAAWILDTWLLYHRGHHRDTNLLLPINLRVFEGRAPGGSQCKRMENVQTPSVNMRHALRKKDQCSDTLSDKRFSSEIE